MPRGRGATLVTLAIGLAGALVQTLAHAAPATLPSGFDIPVRHEAIRAAWTTLSGESPNTLDRSAVEHTCAMKRAMGATQSTPVFEAGTDRPDSVEITRFSGPPGTASYETIHGTACDPASMDATRDLCSCTFRVMTSRYVHIHRDTNGSTEVIDVELSRHAGTRRLRRGSSQPGSAPDPAVFGPVVGHDTVAGVACTLHRLDLGNGRTERCLADATDRIPPTLRLQELARTIYRLGPAGPVRIDWRRTDRIEPEAEVDLGVFEPPAGIAWRTASGAASQP